MLFLSDVKKVNWSCRCFLDLKESLGRHLHFYGGVSQCRTGSEICERCMLLRMLCMHHAANCGSLLEMSEPDLQWNWFMVDTA